MPIIRVEMFEGRDEEQKSRLAEGLTDAFVESCGGKPESVHVVISDIAPQNWAVAGQLVSKKTT
ncbi:MAG: 2-hydroxymuconate tautomerase [Roseovarius sp.]